MEPGALIYLDNNATTGIDPAVLEEMLPFLTSRYGNPSSAYGLGREARRAIDTARERVASLAGCEPREILFTSCGTESTNTALRSALALGSGRQQVVTSAVEHSATLRVCEQLQKDGHGVTYLAVDGEGRLDAADVERCTRPDTAIVSLMWANNETGVLFPVEELSAITRQKRVLFHTDAVQAIGKVPVDLRRAGVQLASLSAHKLHGPKGVGAIFVDRRSAFRPMLLGGGQEEGRRSGTENVAGIVGFGKAAELARENLAATEPRLRQMRDGFERALIEAVPGTVINGAGAPRLPNTSSIAFPGADGEAMLILLDRAGVCCSAGSACRTGSAAPSHVLAAMGVGEARARSTLRFSLSRFNTDAEIDTTIEIIRRSVAKVRALSDSGPSGAPPGQP